MEADEEKVAPAAEESAPSSKVEVDLTLEEDDDIEVGTKPVAQPKAKRAKKEAEDAEPEEKPTVTRGKRSSRAK